MTAEHFWSRVEKTVGCWHWTGAVSSNGYGSLSWHGKMVKPHRVAWELTYGRIEERLLVCHKCDNRLCVNPSHLFLGTHQSNMNDAKLKNRTAKGAETNCTVLSLENVLEIKRLLNKVPKLELAQRFGVDESTIRAIRDGKSWNHVNDFNQFNNTVFDQFEEQI